jgi:hypothetical protein
MNCGDFPTITWTEDKIGQDIFFYRREQIKSFGKAPDLIECLIESFIVFGKTMKPNKEEKE